MDNMQQIHSEYKTEWKKYVQEQLTARGPGSQALQLKLSILQLEIPFQAIGFRRFKEFLDNLGVPMSKTMLNRARAAYQNVNADIIHFDIGDEISWNYKGREEKGIVKWLGAICNELCAGIEFTRQVGFPIESSSGLLFDCRPGHARILPVKDIQKVIYVPHPLPPPAVGGFASPDATTLSLTQTTRGSSIGPSVLESFSDSHTATPFEEDSDASVVILEEESRLANENRTIGLNLKKYAHIEKEPTRLTTVAVKTFTYMTENSFEEQKKKADVPRDYPYWLLCKFNPAYACGPHVLLENRFVMPTPDVDVFKVPLPPPPAQHHPNPLQHHLLPGQHHPPSVQHHLPPGQHHPPSVQHHLPPGQHHPPSVQHHLPPGQHHPPSVHHHLPPVQPRPPPVQTPPPGMMTPNFYVPSLTPPPHRMVYNGALPPGLKSPGEWNLHKPPTNGSVPTHPYPYIFPYWTGQPYRQPFVPPPRPFHHGMPYTTALPGKEK